jgi:hypothetical protein
VTAEVAVKAASIQVTGSTVAKGNLRKQAQRTMRTRNDSSRSLGGFMLPFAEGSPLAPWETRSRKWIFIGG